MNHFRNREMYIKMRVCHKSVTHPFFRYTKISEFFDMAKPGCGFFEDYQVTIAMNDEETKILNLHNEIASTCTTELPQSAQ